MDVGRPPYEILILVCTNVRDDSTRPSCGPRGGFELREAMKQRVKDRGLNVRVRVSQSGCLDLCSRGPNVLVYPEGRLFTGVRVEDVDAILQDLFGPA